MLGSVQRTPPGGGHTPSTANLAPRFGSGLNNADNLTSSPILRICDRLNQGTPDVGPLGSSQAEKKRKKPETSPENNQILIDSELTSENGVDIAAKVANWADFGTVIVVKKSDWQQIIDNLGSLSGIKTALEEAVWTFQKSSTLYKQEFQTQVEELKKEIIDLRKEKEHTAQLRSCWAGELSVGLAEFKKEGQDMKAKMDQILSESKTNKERLKETIDSGSKGQDQVEDQIMEEGETVGKKLIDMGPKFSNSTLQTATEELLVVHDTLKDKLRKIQGDFRDNELKENTQSLKEFEEFKTLRTDMTKWYLACQILKKNSVNKHFDPQPYLTVDTRFSPSAVDREAVKAIDGKFKEACTVADAQLKMASLELNIGRVDKLMKLTEDTNKKWLLAKAFKVVVNSHRNLHDRNLFDRQTRPRQRPERRRERDQRQGYRQDNPQRRNTQRYEEEFPPMKRAEELELDNEVFESDMGPWKYRTTGERPRQDDYRREPGQYRQQEDRRAYYTEDRYTDNRPFRREGEGYYQYSGGDRDRRATEVETDYREYLPYRP